MEYIYRENKKSDPVFILLHGTGGSETDLVPVVEMLDSEYSILGIRGNVQENGMNRYFEQQGEDKYYREKFYYRRKELYDFIIEKSEQYEFKLEDTVLVVFSNGTNIAIQMILQNPEPFKKAAFFAPLYP